MPAPWCMILAAINEKRTMHNESSAEGSLSKRASALLTKLIASGWFDVPDLAAALHVPERALGLYMLGSLEVPVEQQLLLAAVLIEKGPPLSRTGRMLLAQVQRPSAHEEPDDAARGPEAGPLLSNP